MILRNRKFSGKILRKIFWKIFHLTSLSVWGSGRPSKWAISAQPVIQECCIQIVLDGGLGTLLFEEVAGYVAAA
jgi:hypothetical protein